MASEERNALGQLAKFLKEESGGSSAGFKAKVIEKLGEAAWNRHIERKMKFNRASRIIAELAKVEWRNMSGQYLPVINNEFVECLMNCRAIAEEEGGRNVQD